MSLQWRTLVAVVAVTVAHAAAAQPHSTSSGQAYPSRPVRFLNGSPPGSGSDIVARMLAQKLTERLGQPVVVEQKIGGAGLLASDTLAKALPDGQTMALLSGAHAASAAMNRALPFDPVKDFGMVGLVVAYPLVISVPPGSPIKSFPDLIARAKAAPGKLTYSMTPGTLVHLMAEWINIEAGTDIVGVPYKGGAVALVDVLSGRIDVLMETGTFSFGQMRAGKLRPLAISSPARHPVFPDVPTISETLPGVALDSYLGLAVTAGTPRAIIDRLNAEIRSIIQLPDVRKRLTDLSGVPTSSTPEEMAALIERDVARWKRVVELKNIPRQN